MKSVMGKLGINLIPIALCLWPFATQLGCAINRPPQGIQKAITTVNKYLPEYVDEANKALVEIEHPDRERLVGVGLLLVDVLEALKTWAIDSEGTSATSRHEHTGAQQKHTFSETEGSVQQAAIESE